MLGNTLLHYAAECGSLKLVTLLIEKYNYDATITNNCKRNALHHAAMKGHQEVITLLLAKGCSLHSVDCDGENVLSWAAIKSQDHIVSYLLSLGANPWDSNKQGV